MLRELPLLQAAEPKLLVQAAALKSLAVAVLAQAAALKSPEVAEKVFWVVVLLAALKLLLAILAAVPLLVAMAESVLASVLAVCSERFSRASPAATLLLDVTRAAAPAEALLLPLLLLLQLQ
jgi:hypothetical protein